MRVCLGTITLRNDYSIYQEGTDFYVEGVNRRGSSFGERILASAVDHLRQELRGLEVEVEDAAESLERAAAELRLPWSYGRKLHFYAQSALLVLVVAGEADIRKFGRRYFYSLHAPE